MSILMGALGGLGEAMQAVGAKNQAADLQLQNDTANNQQRSDLELQRQQALMQFKSQMDVNVGNQQRTAQVDRINTAAGNIADNANAQQSASINANIADPGSWTADQQAAVDQSQAINKQKMMADPQVLKQAAVSTGDMSIKDALADDARQQGVEAKFGNIDARLQIGQLMSDAKNAKTDADYSAKMAALEAKINGVGGGNTDFDKKIKLLKDSGASSKDIANFITDKKQPSIEDLANGFLKSDPNAGTKKAMSPDDAISKAKALRSLTSSIPDVTPSQGSSAAPMTVGKSPYAEGTSLTKNGKMYVVRNGVPVPQ